MGHLITQPPFLQKMLGLSISTDFEAAYSENNYLDDL